jgi:hypothetical protein
MEYDHLGVGRHNPDYYHVLWPLLEVQDEPINECPARFNIDSYKIVGEYPISPEETRVRVEVNMRAMFTSGDALRNFAISKCNWHETVVFIEDVSTGERFKFERGMNERNLLHIILGKEAETDSILSTKGNWIPIPIPGFRRKWQFDVGLVRKKGDWVLSVKSLPVEHAGLSFEISKLEHRIRKVEERIEMCNGVRAPWFGQTLEYFKKTQCLPASDPEKMLSDELGKLNILRAIQGELK